MHELTVATALFEWASQRSRELSPRKIVAIELENDSFSGLNPDSLEFGFRAMAEETDLAGVRLDFVQVEPAYRCPECGATRPGGRPPALCETCGGGIPRLTSHRGLKVRSIEVE
jgi:hydrogenase nickel incorporation protein HypA/HybF